MTPVTEPTTTAAAAREADPGAADPGAADLSADSASGGEAGPPTAPARPVADQPWGRILRFGGVGALVQVFIALSGMPVGLDGRTIVEPILSLGYLSLVWLPLILGYRVGHQPVLEGMAAVAKGGREVAAGALTGAAAGAGISLLVALLANFDLRDPLVNWSPQLAEVCGFGRGAWFGAAIWLVIGAAVGAAGGALHLLGGPVRRAVIAAAASVAAAAVLETILTDLLGGLGLEAATDWFYAPRGGVSWPGAAVLAAAAAGLAAAEGGRGRVGRARSGLRALEGPARTRANAALMLAVGLAAVVLPLLVGKITNELLANVGLFVLLALGLNIVVGLAGILDLGYVAFYAVGGYTVAVLTAAASPRIAPELPWFAALLVAMVMAGLVGLFIGAPVIRMRGDYLAIVTLGFGEIIRLLFLSDWLSGWFGGAQGITNIPGVQVFGLATVKGTDPRSVLYLVMVFCALAVYASWRLERSRLGRAWVAIREDETVAEAMGVNTVSAKLMAFVVGAVLASFSGAIFSAKVGSIFPSSFLILISIIILVIVIFGGMGSVAGVIAGAVVLIGVLGGPRQPGLLQELSEYKLLVYGALLVWIMLKRPQGLIPNVRRSRELRPEEVLQDAWLQAVQAPARDDGETGGVDDEGQDDGDDGDVEGMDEEGDGEGTDGDDDEGDDGVDGAGEGGPSAGDDGFDGLTRRRRARRAAAPADSPLLQTRGLGVSFGGLQALADLDFEVAEGEIVSVIGPNGAGKTTLFNLISGMVAPTAGDIRFDGTSLLGLDPNQVADRGIARTFQNVRLFDNMTVLENVMVAQHCRTRQGPVSALLRTKNFRQEEAEIQTYGQFVLKFFGARLIGYRQDQPASTLSYANRRRLEIARAMATMPRLILLDEPVAGMNPVESARLTEQIGLLRSDWGFTVVLIEHDMNVVRDVSDRVVVLDHGEAIAQGSYQEVSTDPAVIEAYLGRKAEAP